MNITLETAADKLVKEIFGVKSGETVIITADDDSDASVVEAVKNSAKNAGAHAMVISVPTPGGVGKAADPDLPVDALSAALLCADVWIEFNHQWLLYSTPFERAEAENKKNALHVPGRFQSGSDDSYYRQCGDRTAEKIHACYH